MLQPKDTDWLNGLKSKTCIYIYCLQETNFRPKDTYRLKVWKWKKVLFPNGNKKSWGSYTHIRQNRLKKVTRDKGCYMTNDNDKRINPRRYNNCKYVCMQHRNTTV